MVLVETAREGGVMCERYDVYDGGYDLHEGGMFVLYEDHHAHVAAITGAAEKKIEQLESELAAEREMLDHLIDQAYSPHSVPGWGVHLSIGVDTVRGVDHDWGSPEVRAIIRAAIKQAMKGGE